ncbi:glycoside hydrolase family 16 protein [Flavisolibacter nicotianae]|uniref:glycoside hydrolase family 16 protein n=1 Tax=Flavisolibacter nicotianae TaxID=2364882 RepID=UPI000EB4EAAE|nr:glycoside hydrolase family 16 protein [Flavisolibacter nicotianae]
MRRLIFSLVVLSTVVSCSRKAISSGAAVQPQPTPTAAVSYSFESTPVWQDEFDYTGRPDPAKWGYDLGGSGWGNNELEYYTNAESNAGVANGKLSITARKEQKEGRDYTSARLVTKNKFDFLYGRVEVRAKLPSGRGTWPAIWMLATDNEYGGWPRSGEIDIMEHVGYDPNRVLFSVHTEAYNHVKGTQKSGAKIIPTAMTDFHTYRLDWTPGFVKGFYDGEEVFSFENDKTANPDTWPFNKRFHLLLNLAIGGNWGGAKGVDDSIFPATMEVDYVRVYKMK